MPFPADSALKDSDLPSFQGLMSILPSGSASAAVTTMKAFARLGLSMLDCSDLTMSDLRTNSIQQLKRLQENCQAAGLRMMGRVKDTETGMKALDICQGRLIVRLTVSHFEPNELITLMSAGGFILLEEDRAPNLVDYKELGAQLKAALETEYATHIGITASPILIRALLDAGVSVEDLTAMSSRNLRVYLRDWWIDGGQ